MKRAFGLCMVLLFVWAAASQAENGAEPTFADVAYGPYERNILDFWQAPSESPTPVIVWIHGGGFIEGSKNGFRRYGADNIRRCQAADVSVAAINYRFITTAALQDIVRDSARAIQFLRYQAKSWNIDKTRIMSFGDSAGAGMSLWLAFHDDLADPDNADPVLRESTRLFAAGALAPQASYDFSRWPEILGIPQLTWWITQYYVSPTYYHLRVAKATAAERRRVHADLDMLAWIDPKDPPVFLFSDRKDGPLDFDILHHPAHVRALQKACEAGHVSCTVVDLQTPPEKRINAFDFFLERLGSKNPR